MDEALGDRGHLGELPAVVDAEHLVGVGELVGVDRALVRAQDRKDVGQVVLALGVVGAHLGERRDQRPGVEGEHPGVDLADLELEHRGVARGLGLGHPLHRPIGGAHDPAVALRILQDHGGDRRRRSGVRVLGDEAGAATRR